MASTYLTNTNPTAGNRTKGTISVWFKRSGLGSYQHLYTEHYDGNNFGSLRLNNSDTLSFLSYDGGSAQADIGTTRKFRDTNAWYHVVASWNTTDGTASDRVKIYINGVRETSFSGSPTYPSSSQSIYFGVGGTNYPIRVGSISNSAQFFDGSMSHFHRVDNQALAQTVFGSTDSTTGEWKITTNPSISYTGSSDFNLFILKDGNSVTDQSGQSNNLTVGGGTLTKTEDCPSNVFCTFNPLIAQGNQQNFTYSLGNTKVYSSSTGQESFTLGTLAFSSGKYYWEWMADGSDPEGNFWGVMDIDTHIGNGNINTGGNDNIWGSNQGNKFNGSNGGTYGTNVAVGEKGMVACDMDNGKLWFGKNGTWFSSGGSAGNPASGTYAGFTNLAGHIITPFHSDNYSTKTPTGTYNFGNGYFGTTAVSSAGSNASGLGIFEYDVPTGFTALCTKGLNE